MIEYDLAYKVPHRTYHTNTIYHIWDIPANRKIHTDVKEVKPEHVGDFFQFDDGSGWLSPILTVFPYTIRTELCVIRKQDYVHKANVHPSKVNYTGMKSSHEHFLVRKPTFKERSLARDIAKGKYTPTKWTERMKVLTIEEMQKAGKKLGVDETYFIDKLKGFIEQPTGTIEGKTKALVTLGRVMGVELENNKAIGSGNTFNLFNTVQQQRRNSIPPPETKDMKEILSVYTEVVEDNEPEPKE